MTARGNGQDRGLSLIELVVAMAIFALVAIMGAQALTGMLRMRDGVTHRSAETAALAEATSLLRADLSAAVPMFFQRPGGGGRASAIEFRDNTLGLSVAGQQTLRGAADETNLTRVEWQLRDGRLTRRVWPALYPALTTSLSPEQLVMEGVTGLRLRSYVDDSGWIEGTPTQQFSGDGFDEDQASAPSSYSNALPLAIEVTLQTHAFGDIPLLESYR